MKRGFNRINKNSFNRNQFKCGGSHKGKNRNKYSPPLFMNKKQDEVERNIELIDNMNYYTFSDDTENVNLVKRMFLMEKIKKPSYVMADGTKIFVNKFGREYREGENENSSFFGNFYTMSAYTYTNNYVIYGRIRGRR